MNTALNMIIGNKPEPFLKYALESTKWLDEHVIINTGSENNFNFNIVKEILPDAKIFQFEGEFTFANARNFALERTDSPWVLWQDADEVHFNSFKAVVKHYTDENICDAVEFGFYHFLLDMFHYQSIDLRLNLFKRSGKMWIGNVHEQIIPPNIVISDSYRYHHYGYTKPQKDIYDNWRLYWSLNPDERWKLSEKRNPDDIISDRVTVAKDYQGEYPEVIKDYVKMQPVLIKDYKFI